MTESRPLLAVAWMMGALASFTGMALAGRELTAEMSVFQAMALRSVICVTVLALIAWRVGFRKVTTARFPMHLARSVAHFGGTYAWIFGISVLPLAAVFSIEFTTPIWTALLGAVFLRERLTRWRLAGIALGFAGILVIVRPGSGLFDVAAFVVLGAAWCYSTVYAFTRAMAPTESPLAIIFWMNLIQLPLGLVPALGVWVAPSPHAWPWIAVIGIAGLTSHYCVAHAMRHADAALVAPMDFVRLPLIAVVGWLFYAEPFNPFVLAGGALIFAGNMTGLWGERRRRLAAAVSPKRASGS
ncbi:membrane protein [Thalassobaculum fulvum]|uniref:Membrane protein n=1 Tax=Thalassobaculum fulvum TaxID=1633335 RepID=A0A918XV07_9PROT|nr:DMT family transporter [Thalassobaculum fulvum]GHD58405.1 membrane protein [Thalassobaculum fulvum]